MCKETTYWDCEFCEFDELITYEDDGEILDVISHCGCGHKDNVKQHCILDNPMGDKFAICKFLT